jgi:HTH-like domain
MISRQAIYAVPRRPPADATRTAPPRRGVDEPVERAIVALCREDGHQSDGYRMITALVARRLGWGVNRKRVLRVMRLHGPLERRRALDRRVALGGMRVQGRNSAPCAASVWRAR